MIVCPICHEKRWKRDGMMRKEIMYKRGKRVGRVQLYRCSQGHQFRKDNLPSWDDSFIEYVVFVYLKCLSLNTTVDIIRETFEMDILSKAIILEFIASVGDALPSMEEIDVAFAPVRSGHVAFDGVWFKLKGEQIVLLVAFDPKTMDVINAVWREEEDARGYEELIAKVTGQIGIDKIRAIYSDGDNGFLKARSKIFTHIPYQVCVFHKELRMGQIVPVKNIHRSKRMTDQKKHDIKIFQLLFRDVIYATDKEKSSQALERLKQYVKSQKEIEPRFQKAYRSLLTNFKYTLTHFDYPYMERDNNMIENFNSVFKPRLKLMKGFKKEANIDRYLKLFLLQYRLHPLKESGMKERNGNSPLELSGTYIPKNYNFLHLLRTTFNIFYQLPQPEI